MPQAPIFSLTRRQLYDQIWEISVAGLAKKHDIPYEQLRKHIKEAQIPIPPSGYWTKLSFGKPVIKPELAEPFDQVVTIFPATTAFRKENPNPMPAKKKMETDASPPHKDTIKGTLEPTSLCQLPPEIQAETGKATQEVIDEPETIVRYGQKYNVYSREELYKEIWKAPITEVAKRYKVSDVAIHNICKALDIPNPPRGYWAKLHAGKPVSVIPLPKSDKPAKKTGIQTGITYQSHEEEERLAHLSDEEKSIILTVASQILIPNENARMHAKIIAHRKVISEWKKEQKNTANRAWGQRNADPAPYLAQSISSDMIPRACRIIDALIKAMEPLGCALTGELRFTVDRETVELSFSESQDKVAHIPTKEENMLLLKYEEDRKRNSWASKPQIRKYDYVYNGKLTVAVNGRKSFRDCKSYVVEERVGDIMIEMYQAAEVQKLARAAHEEAERKRLEEAERKEQRRKRYNTEVDRTLALTSLAEDYDTACKIRRYIAVVESSDSLGSEKADWIEWAKGKADWYDPAVARDDDFFGKREHSKPKDKKELVHIGYWW
ncbi:MAG: hypothetical protein FWF69_10165 [Firmicutes bacterium]|nr:hypothetical protein [Bacillota bacterium]